MAETAQQVRTRAQATIEAALDTRASEALALVQELRQDLVERLSAASGLELSRLADLLVALDAGVLRLKDQLVSVLEGGQQDAVRQGAALVKDTLAALDLQVLLPDVTEALLVTLQDTTLGLVTSLSANLRTDLVREVQLGALGVKSPFDVIQDIGRLLDADGATGYAARAETITRTEIGRAQSQATQQRLEDATRTLGERVQKEWRHSGLPLHPRSAHVAAHGQRRPVREPFSVGGVSLMYPRDPAAPAASTVNCRCVMTPYVKQD